MFFERSEAVFVKPMGTAEIGDFFSRVVVVVVDGGGGARGGEVLDAAERGDRGRARARAARREVRRLLRVDEGVLPAPVEERVHRAVEVPLVVLEDRARRAGIARCHGRERPERGLALVGVHRGETGAGGGARDVEI